MVLGDGVRLTATGVVKKFFRDKREPYGFMLLLTPIELRGTEASFFFADMQLPRREREILPVGMQMVFDIIDKPEDWMKSEVPFRALNMRALPVAQYQATVTHPPSGHNSLFRVALDITLDVVNVTLSSYHNLERTEPLAEGDPCVVELTWKEMLDAVETKRLPTAKYVSAGRMVIAGNSAKLGVSEVEPDRPELPPTPESMTNDEHDPNDGVGKPSPIAKDPAHKAREQEWSPCSPPSSCCSCEEDDDVDENDDDDDDEDEDESSSDEDSFDHNLRTCPQHKSHSHGKEMVPSHYGNQWPNHRPSGYFPSTSRTPPIPPPAWDPNCNFYCAYYNQPFGRH